MPATSKTPPLEERQKPGLSETLSGIRDPRHCQSCGAEHRIDHPLMRWIEHDEWDRLPKKPAVVVLCASCSDRLIEPHPRLYTHLHDGAPFPGCMSVCLKCTHRVGVSCSNPVASVNGGPGLELEWKEKPLVAIVCPGGRQHIYRGPVIACSGRQEASDAR